MAYIRGSRHPHEVLLLIASFLMGIAGLTLFDKVATTTIRARPQLAGYVLYAGLVVGASVSLCGIVKRTITGFVVERSGLFCLGMFALVYAAIVLINSGARGMSFSLFMIAFGVANLLRVQQIGKEIDELRAVEVYVKDGEVHGVD